VTDSLGSNNCPLIIPSGLTTCSYEGDTPVVTPGDIQNF
jgi:hypothetical protein